MRPMTFINGVIFGSSGALGGVLVILIFFRWVLTQDSTLDQTVVLSSLPLHELVKDMLIFLVMAGVSGTAFVGELFRKPWRGVPDYLQAVLLVGIILYFFADPATLGRDLVLLGLAAFAGAVLLTALSRLGLLRRIAAWLGD
ncbi:MAG TPA: hypothetical protein VGV16_09985 [Gammaproteobacteria bacterium]|nr:hypothetical protein [Gammaproteobacteria bacterium]